MITKHQTYTKFEFTYKTDDGEEGETIVFETDGCNETVKIGEKQFPFEMLSEIVNAVENTRKRPEPSKKGPVITDHRKEEKEEIENIIQSAEGIQKQVDESMSKYDDTEEFISLTSSVKQEAPSNLDIKDDEDPIGIPLEEMESFGPGSVPETPERFKNQLEEIAKERASKPVNVDSSKKIRHK